MLFFATSVALGVTLLFRDPIDAAGERLDAFDLILIVAILFFPPVPSAAPQPPDQEPFTYSDAEFRVGYDISDTQPLTYIKDSQGESPLPIDRIEEHPGPRELIVEGDWVTLRLPQEKE